MTYKCRKFLVGLLDRSPDATGTMNINSQIPPDDPHNAVAVLFAACAAQHGVVLCVPLS
jgi:hypothetical protein